MNAHFNKWTTICHNSTVWIALPLCTTTTCHAQTTNNKREMNYCATYHLPQRVSQASLQPSDAHQRHLPSAHRSPNGLQKHGEIKWSPNKASKPPLYREIKLADS
jgi:hypothetical protein